MAAPRSRIILTLSIFVICVNNFITAEDTVVQLPKGKIRGHILKSENGSDYYAFQEIPYAAPPIGKNRYKLPTEPEPWTGILNTTKNTVICYQIVTKHYNLTNSEDCLYMNIYTPLKPGTKDKVLPVLVWIHGGGYTAESSTYEYYGPQYIMDHGVVVVTFNYRLGPFGFLTTEDDIIPANLGMKDQRFALKWISDNIELFGGNRSHITIVGESAGAGAVGLHILGQWGTGQELFHSAIMQSGSPLWRMYGTGRKSAFEIGQALDKTFNSQNSSDLLKLLQEAPGSSILHANVTASWVPLVEKEGDFSYPMLESFMNGNFKKIPLLIGINSEEWLYFAQQTNILDQAAGYDRNPSTILNSDLLNISSTNKSIAGELLRRVYTNSSFQTDLGPFIRYLSDRDFSTTTLKQAELESKYTDVYFYQFAYKGILGGEMHLPILPGAERVAHAEDLHYMWDDGSNSDLSKFPEADQLMLHRYVKMWTNFVKYNNPTPEQDPLLQNIIWPKVNPNTPEDIKYLNMNVTFEIRSNPRNYQQVKKIQDEYILPPYIVY